MKQFHTDSEIPKTVYYTNNINREEIKWGGKKENFSLIYVDDYQAEKFTESTMEIEELMKKLRYDAVFRFINIKKKGEE